MYASLTRTTGPAENVAELAVMAGETMVAWLRDIEGFEGLLILTEPETGAARTITLWASREVAERHQEARMRMRDRVTTTVDAHVEGTVSYEVPFVWLSGRE